MKRKILSFVVLFLIVISNHSFAEIKAYDEWTTLNNGIEGGFINSIVVDSSDGDTIYASSPFHGIFMSQNHGENWENISLNIKKKSFNALMINYQDNNCLYAASYDRLYRTYNNGETWEKSDNTFQGIVDILSLPDGSILLCTNTGLFRSYGHVNDFKFYRSLSATAGNADATSIAINSNNEIIALGTANLNVMLSFDAGSTWTRISNNLPTDKVVSVFFDSSDINRLYALLKNNGLWRYDIIRLDTREDRIEWQLVHPELRDLNATIALLSSHDDPDILVGTEDDGLLIYSIKNHKVWKSSLYQTDFFVTYIATSHSNPKMIIVGSSIYGCIISNDYAEKWRIVNNDLSAVTTYDLKVSPVDPYQWYTASFGSIFSTFDGGKSWQINHKGLPRVKIKTIAISPINSDFLLAGTSELGLFQSFDGGKSFEKNNSFPFLRLNCIAISNDHENSIYIGTQGRGLFKSIDGGKNWKHISFDQSLSGRSVFVSHITIDPLDTSILYIGSTDEGIYKSNDKGLTWKHIYEPLGSNIFINDIQINENNTNIIYAGINIINDGGIIRSMDKGATWETLNLFRRGMIFNTILLEELDDEILYAGTRESLFFSKNGGYHWQEYCEGINQDYWDEFDCIYFHTVLKHPLQYKSLLASNRWGVFESSQSELIFDREPPVINILKPDSFPHFSNDGKVNIKGYVSDNVGVKRLIINDEENKFNHDDGKFDYYFEFDTNNISINLTAFDLADNKSELKLDFVLDTQLPSLVINEPINHTKVKGNEIFISGYAEDFVSGIKKVLIDKTSVELKKDNSRYFFNYKKILTKSGENEIVIEAYDRANNKISTILKVMYEKVIPLKPPKLNILSDLVEFKQISPDMIINSTFKPKQVIFQNTGEEVLELTFTSFPSWISITPDQLRFEPETTQEVSFQVIPSSVAALKEFGPLEGDIQGTSNDPTQTTFSLPFTAIHGILLQLRIGSSTAFINHKNFILDSPPLIRQGRTLVPVRFIAEAFGAQVEWIPHPTNEVQIFLQGKLLHLWIGRTEAIMEYPGTARPPDKLTLDTPPLILQGRTLVPLRFIVEAFGAEVQWDGATETITITWGG